MPNQRSNIPISSSTRLGLDMDLTITDDPAFFASLASKVKEAGGQVIVFAARAPDTFFHTRTRDELAKYKFPYDDIFYLPDIEEAVRTCPHRDSLGHYPCYLWHKVKRAEQACITHYVDDEAVVHDLFRQFLPSVVKFYPWELYPPKPPIPEVIDTTPASELVARCLPQTPGYYPLGAPGIIGVRITADGKSNCE